LLIKWAIVIGSGLAIAIAPVPSGIHLGFVVFAGDLHRDDRRVDRSPLCPAGRFVLLGIAAVILTRVMPVDPALAGNKQQVETVRIKQALAGYADPVVWLVLAAFFMSRGMLKTGLGRRIAFIFIRAIGRRSLGLGYALAGTRTLSGLLYSLDRGACRRDYLSRSPRSIAEAYDSKPGPTAGRIGAFLMSFMYQCEVIICSMFFTGRPAISDSKIRARYGRGRSQLRALDARRDCSRIGFAVRRSILLYRIYPPEIRHTPRAGDSRRKSLKRWGDESGRRR
jgi:DASS family divalent anion:Na+ symporter